MNGKSRRRYRPKRAGGGGRPVPAVAVEWAREKPCEPIVAGDGKSAVKRTGYRMFFIPYLVKKALL
ncbi:MAG: hypothetical protein NUV45_04975 [Tepidanaerobacteraceae bacterium]|nr:hypothetical protein [Tepidanaerobacteraceae bacterium]